MMGNTNQVTQCHIPENLDPKHITVGTSNLNWGEYGNIRGDLVVYLDCDIKRPKLMVTTVQCEQY